MRVGIFILSIIRKKKQTSALLRNKAKKEKQKY